MLSASTKTGAFKALLAVVALTLAGLLTGCGAMSDAEESFGEISQSVCTGVKLAATPLGPQAVGTQVTLTASNITCGGGQTAEYMFRWFKEGSSTSGTIRAYATGTSTVWNTTGLASGTYQVIVYARAVGSTAAFESTAYLAPNYLIGNVCNFTSSFTSSPTSPQPVGTSINLTAAATCTSGAAEYRFAYNPPGTSTYTSIGGFGAATQTWNTTGLPTGAYNLIVYARGVGNTSTYESYKYSTFNLGAGGSVCSTGTSLSASPPSPQPLNSTITLTGASTCSAPQFRFSYRANGNSAWILTGLSAFSSSPQTWNTTGLPSGTYNLLVEARNTGNIGQAESTAVINYSIGSTCSSLSLSPSPAGPSIVGTQVTLTGNATCSSGATAEYRYSYSQNGSTYTSLRGYGPAAYVWDTTNFASGGYVILAEARAVGSTGLPESTAAISYALTPAYATQANSGGGSHHACARASNGGVRCWGANDFGQLGTGSASALSSSPVIVNGLNNVTAVATGYRHSCAVLTDNTVRCWGSNQFGQLGNNSMADSFTPVAASGLSNAVAITAGEYHSCVLTSAGGVTCWGRNAQLQAGTGVSDPVLVPTVGAGGVTTGATAVVAGGFHTCAIVGGALKCWGDNSLGQLGTGGTPQNTKDATQVPGLTSGVTSVGSGDVHVCAAVGGGVQCWGDNTYGQLGNGTTSMTPSTSPAAVSGLSGVAEVASGFVFSCARLSNQTVRCWGRNAEGEVGDGTGVDRLSPAAVSGISTATAITTGALNGCALLANNTTRCWGYGGLGGLGNGSSADALSPVLVALP
jgi:alpha-tubulin suppressor-like RCC1 family protein